MKINIWTFTFIILITGLSYIKAQPAIDFIRNEEANFYSLQKQYKDYWAADENKDKKGWKQFNRWEYFWETRVKEDGSFPNAIEMWNELNQFKKLTPETQADKIWYNHGPNTNPKSSQSGIGRVNIIRFKTSQKDEIWLGAASGGVWRSKDRGNSWEGFDFFQSMTLGVSDIAFCESNENVVYVATGDADGIGAAYSTYSAGVIKSTDDGLTWNFTNLIYDLDQGKIVASILVHPDNPDIILASTSGGILKSSDGGVNWLTKTTDNGYYKTLEKSPDNPNIVVSTTYANSGATGIYRSTDFGETWEKVYNFSGVRRSAIDFAPGNGNYIYALATGGTYFHSFLKSTDAGKTWTTTATINNTPNMLGLDQGTGSDRTYGQGWYDLTIAVSPFDENIVYTGGINIWRTENGGSSFSLITHWVGGYSKPYVHADIHHLDFDLYYGYLYSGGDGGIDYSNNPISKWTNLNNHLPITQYYKIAVAADKDNVVYGGAQDNGSHKLDGNQWNKVYGGDGMDCVVDYTDYKRAIVSIYFGTFFKTLNGSNFYEVLNRDDTGESAAWVAPIAINPINQRSYYAGYKNLWKSIDGGYDWFKASNINFGTLLNMAISKADTNVIYVSSSSTLAKTTNGGQTFVPIEEAPPLIKGITIDQNNPHRIWVALGGFTANRKVWMYDGETWTNMSGNIPNVPVNCIVYQENSPDRLYIGTDIGTMFSDYNSAHWEFYGSQMPNVIVSDLEIEYRTKKLFAGTYGRGVWSTDLNMCNLEQPEISVDGQTSICEGEEVKLTAMTESSDLVWSTGESTKSIKVSTEGIYSYSLPNIGDCSVRSQSVSISVKKVPEIKITPVGNYPACEGDTFDLELSASFGFSGYLWSTGETNRRIRIVGPGTYSVIGLTKDECEANSEIKIDINTIPEKPTITRLNSLELMSSEANSYQWYLDGKKLAGKTDRILELENLGNYYVEVFNEQECSNISEIFVITTDVSENDESGIDLYPNPTTGILNISLPSIMGSVSKISMTDIVGTELNHYDLTDNMFRIDMSNYPSGIYFVKVFLNDSFIIRRVVKY